MGDGGCLLFAANVVVPSCLYTSNTRDWFVFGLRDQWGARGQVSHGSGVVKESSSSELKKNKTKYELRKTANTEFQKNDNYIEIKLKNKNTKSDKCFFVSNKSK